jgi:DNA/RNA endonuclease YhcR with UshA esterase domain
MNEKIILTICFLFSLAGLFGLYLFSESMDYSEKTIEKIKGEKLQEMIKLQGEVIRSTTVGNVTFITLEQPSTIDVIVFDNVTIYPGERVEIIGKSEEYNKEMEIIAHRIRVIE